MKNKPLFERGDKSTRVVISESNGKSGTHYHVYWRELGSETRKFKNFRNKADAIAHAMIIYEQLKNGLVPVGMVTQQRLNSLAQAEEILAGTGMTPASAANRVIGLISQLPSGKTLEGILQCGLAHDVTSARVHRTIEQVTPDFLKWLESQGLEKRTCVQYSVTLKKLAKLLHGKSISIIDVMILDSYLSRFNHNKEIFRHERGRIHKLLRWGRQNGLFQAAGELPTQLVNVPKFRTTSEPPKIYEIEVIEMILRDAPKALMPVLRMVISGLIRPEEAYRLTWEQVFLYWAYGWLYIPWAAAKSVGDRYSERWVPLTPLIKYLLTPYLGRTGPICPSICSPSGFNIAYSKFLLSRTIVVPRGLRKSGLSSLVAGGVTRHVSASWAGNSEQVISVHYNNPACTQNYSHRLAGVILGKLADSPEVYEVWKVIRATPIKPLEGLVAKNLIGDRKIY